MKYTITVNQLVLSKTSLDIIDAAILDYIYWLCSSVNPTIDGYRIRDDDGVWTWIDFSHLLSEMPMLHIKAKGAITERIKKIEKEEYIVRREIRGKNGNRKMYVRVTPKMDTLFTQMNRRENPIHVDEQATHDPIHTDEWAYSSKRIDNNTNNHITTNNFTKDVDNTLEVPLRIKAAPHSKNYDDSDVVTRLYQRWNSLPCLMKHKALTVPMKKAVAKAMKDGHDEMEINRAIDNYSLVLDSDQYYFTYRWTFQDFLARAIDKFKDMDIVNANYSRKTGRQGGGTLVQE